VAFETDVYLRNFEIWQLGMLFIVLQDLEDELIRIGSGRSRGLGSVTASLVEQDRGEYPGGLVASTMRYSGEPEKQLWGLGRWLSDEQGRWRNGESYGTWPDDHLELSKPGERKERGIRVLQTFKGDALKALRVQTVEKCLERMHDWPPPSAALVREQFQASLR
jgi:hypothetical protein